MKRDLPLQQDVMVELKWEPVVNAKQIGAGIKANTVVLGGEVGSYTNKMKPKRAAQCASDTNVLVVGMKIKLTELDEQIANDIANSARHVLNWISSLPDDAIQIIVEDGWITMSGQMPWRPNLNPTASSKTGAMQAVMHLAVQFLFIKK